MPEKIQFVAKTTAVIYEQPVAGKSRGKNALQHLLWGDEVTVFEGDGEWFQVEGRRVKGWLHGKALQEERLLEVNFVDIGQGDGCIVGTPDGEQILIDAGEGDNMYRFLRWRFHGFKEDVHFKAAVITHPDKDHYFGFKPLFDEERVHFETVYHSGIVERVGDEVLGASVTDPDTARKYLVDLARTLEDLRQVTDKPDLVGRKLYPNLLKAAVDGERVGSLRSLWAQDAYLPGFEADQPLTIEVLGPVTETPAVAEGRSCLRWFDDNVGKTKNGHSVVLRATYGDVSLLLGGDLNIPAENYLLERYTGLPMPPAPGGEDEVVARGRGTFRVDIAKSCHHGSADFSSLFLRCLNPVATVISSGDDESHSHPRPETLGAVGRNSRGARPLIFSTELARSSRESIKHPFELRRKLLDQQEAIEAAEGAAAKEAARKAFADTVRRLERSVAVYGMITLRTDGEKVLFAQKLEKPRSNSSKWDVYVLEPGLDGELEYRSRHGH